VHYPVTLFVAFGATLLVGAFFVCGGLFLLLPAAMRD